MAGLCIGSLVVSASLTLLALAAIKEELYRRFGPRLAGLPVEEKGLVLFWADYLRHPVTPQQGVMPFLSFPLSRSPSRSYNRLRTATHTAIAKPEQPFTYPNQGLQTAANPRAGAVRSPTVTTFHSPLAATLILNTVAGKRLHAQQLAVGVLRAPEASRGVPVLTGDVLVLGTREKARHLVNLLRPELVRKADKPLSSDAFTGFGTAQPSSTVGTPGLMLLAQGHTTLWYTTVK